MARNPIHILYPPCPPHVVFSSPDKMSAGPSPCWMWHDFCVPLLSWPSRYCTKHERFRETSRFHFIHWLFYRLLTSAIHCVQLWGHRYDWETAVVPGSSASGNSHQKWQFELSCISLLSEDPSRLMGRGFSLKNINTQWGEAISIWEVSTKFQKM